MLSVLTQCARQQAGHENNGFEWHQLNQQTLCNIAPFWQPQDIQRICTNLRDQGLILIASAPFVKSKTLKFAFNENIKNNQASEPLRQNNRANQSGKNFISPNWQPDQETLGRLAQHNISESFCRELVAEFVQYWRDSGETATSWGAKFFHHAKRRWVEYEAEQNAQQKESPMPRNWRPSPDALDVLTRHGGISLSFIEDAIPEFELYWREQGSTSDNWNKKFRDHVHRQWLRYKSALEHDTVPRRIPENWRPSQDVYEVLRLANIDIPFAQTLIPEFVIYWRDSNQVHPSWNTRFLQYVKYRWARRDLAEAQQAKSTRELSLEEQLTDRSWAL